MKSFNTILLDKVIVCPVGELVKFVPKAVRDRIFWDMTS